MLCPECKCGTRVLDTAKHDTYIRRRVECTNCGHRFWTREYVSKRRSWYDKRCDSLRTGNVGE